MHGTFSDGFRSQTAILISSNPPESDVPPAPWQWKDHPLGAGRTLLMVLLAVSGAALLAPFALVAALLASDAAAREILAAHPAVGVQLALGLLALVGLFLVPLALLTRRAFERREILIDGAFVHAREPGVFGARCWREPVEAYDGLAHRVRSSLSGTSHELVLVHPRADRSVIVFSGAKLLEAEAEFIARSARFAEIRSRETPSVRAQGAPVSSAASTVSAEAA